MNRQLEQTEKEAVLSLCTDDSREGPVSWSIIIAHDTGSSQLLSIIIEPVAHRSGAVPFGVMLGNHMTQSGIRGAKQC
jgi:hypothetical protein